MALIERFIVVSDHISVKAGEEIVEGDWVKLDSSSGSLIKCTTAGEKPYGIAGDTKSTSVSGLPATNSSSQGAFVNRLSDSFDETKASGKLTVYHSGGRFATDRYGTVSGTVGAPLYVDVNGKLTTTSAGAAVVVGTLISGPAAFDSGVPGIDTSNGSLQLTNNYIEFKLEV